MKIIKTVMKFLLVITAGLLAGSLLSFLVDFFQNPETYAAHEIRWYDGVFAISLPFCAALVAEAVILYVICLRLRDKREKEERLREARGEDQ